MNDSADRTTYLALIERQATAWQTADIAAIIADFAPDGVFASPGGTWVGTEAIAAAARAFFAVAGEVQIQIVRTIIDRDQAAIEWVWSELRYASKQRVMMEDAIIVRFQASKIQYWREYFAPK